jgi:hypothetical protein
MATPYTVGDTSPALTGTVSASLVGATVEVHISRPDATVITHAGTVVNAALGSWSMALVAGDLNQSGTYRVEVQVTFAGGAVQTFYYDTEGNYGHFTVRDQIA